MTGGLLVVIIILSILGAGALSVLYYLGILKKAGNKFLQFVHDLISFKTLYVEQILRVLYVFLTVFVVIYGMIVPFASINYYFSFGQALLECLASIVLGPIVIRLVYEFLMMLILAISHLSAIRKNTETLAKQAETAEKAVVVKAEEAVSAENTEA